MTNSEHLVAKDPLILITNRCNLSCGGCNQLCPSIAPDNKWDIPLDQLRDNIETLSMFYTCITIFGGEPTCHPKWKEVKALLRTYHTIDFWVFTNRLVTKGALPKTEGNIYYHCDNEMRAKDAYVPTLIAPIDIYKMPNKGFYWKMAQKYCWMGHDPNNAHQCPGILYNDKAYLCQPAGAMEYLLGTDFGWQFIPSQNPFLRSDKEIAQQAREFCYRCAFAFDPETRHALAQQQPLDRLSLATQTNYGQISRNTQLVTIEEILPILSESARNIRHRALRL